MELGPSALNSPELPHRSALSHDGLWAIYGDFGNYVGRCLLAIWSDLKRSDLAADQDFHGVADVGYRPSEVFSLGVRIDVQMALLILLAAATPTGRIAAWGFSCHGCSQTSVYRFPLSP